MKPSLDFTAGKTYFTKSGDKVTLSEFKDCIYPFLGTNGFYYTSKGGVHIDNEKSNYDLVTEYEEEEEEEEESISVITYCPHYELMLEYIKDCAESQTPWLSWEHKGCYENTWGTLSQHPNWQKDVSYRRKVKTILINGFEVPEPLRVAPEWGTIVYFVDILQDELFDSFTYGIMKGGDDLIKLGLSHLAKDAAIRHAQALLSLTKEVK